MPPKKIVFPFIEEALLSKHPVIKPMFGCQAIYIGEKLMLMMRNKEDHVDANGVWIATSREHHETLKKEIPCLRSVYILSNGKNETEWQMIPIDDDDFETLAMKVCDMILRNDPRIGKIPKSKKKRG
ncbi:MAG TPA: hypothetical protein VL651_04670 [Bacteroidia bacterium]|jgi:hypothetical protein|nr:hypothetical protein [Bacteroidia bacterium]